MPHQSPRSRALLALTASLLSVALSCTVGGVAGADQPHRTDPKISISSGSTTPRVDRAVDGAVDDLGPSRTGGGYVDDHGAPVITVTSSSARHDVAASGVTTRQVDHSLRQLRRAQAALDRYARRHGAGAVQEWHIDVVANRVRVTAVDSATDPATRDFVRFARSLGDEVEIDSVDAAVRPAGRTLYSSDNIILNNRLECSVGFNAVDSRNRPIFVTAGHCLHGASAAFRGSFLGTALQSRYPGSDFGAVLTDTADWSPEPAVNKYDGHARAVLGTARPPVGTEVCKSSSSSGWTCGTVQAYDQTVNYGGGNIVYGLVRFNACVEPGDSGGAVMDGSSAVGIISGAQFFATANGTEVCGNRVGEPNVSFYQPIGPALQSLDARLLTYRR